MERNQPETNPASADPAQASGAPAVEHLLSDDGRTRAIICDLDGTLALLTRRGPYEGHKCELDELSEPIAHILKTYHEAGFAIVLVSGREDRHRRPTERWLRTHKVVYDALFMRPTKDFRKDAIIKRELYDREIRDNYDVLFVLDDRNQVVRMWRDLGLQCLQVADGDF